MVEWKELGQLGSFENIGSDKKIIEGEKIVTLLNYVDVYHHKYIDSSVPKMQVSASDRKIKDCSVLQGDIYVTPSSETIDDIGHSAVITETIPNAVYSYHIMRYRLFEKNMLLSYYINYMFDTELVKKQILKKAQGLTRFGLTKDKFASIKLPIPSVSEQKHIVDCLNTFTSSIDNLKQQIAERRKQFEYYCDQYYGGDYNGMMAFSNNPGCSVVPFSELGTITRGKRFVRDDVRESGQPCIHYGDMYTYYGTKAHQANTFLDRDFPKKMRYAHKGDVVIVGAGENDYDIGVGVVWLGDEPAAVHDACYILEHNLNPMYISYYLRSNIYHQQLKKFVSSGKISSFSAEGLGKVLIPIQSKEKQQEIVSALETFEESISKLEQMVELRQKQYEYYREKLLTFE